MPPSLIGFDDGAGRLGGGDTGTAFTAGISPSTSGMFAAGGIEGAADAVDEGVADVVVSTKVRTGSAPIESCEPAEHPSAASASAIAAAVGRQVTAAAGDRGRETGGGRAGRTLRRIPLLRARNGEDLRGAP